MGVYRGYTAAHMPKVYRWYTACIPGMRRSVYRVGYTGIQPPLWGLSKIINNKFFKRYIG